MMFKLHAYMKDQDLQVIEEGLSPEANSPDPRKIQSPEPRKMQMQISDRLSIKARAMHSVEI